jgi:hypothetical protein
MRFVLVLFTVCALVVPALAQSGLPAPWKPLRSKGASLQMDLDGDGKPDLAVLATDGHKTKAFAFISQPGGRRVVALMECGDTARRCVLESLPPGRYVTACGKRLAECDGSPEEIVSKTALLSLKINDYIEVVLLLHGADVQPVWLTD